MLGGTNYNFATDSPKNISYSVTLVPRLEYSVTILDDIIQILKKKKFELKKFNREIIDLMKNQIKIIITCSIEQERTVLFSLEILLDDKRNNPSNIWN